MKQINKTISAVKNTGSTDITTGARQHIPPRARIRTDASSKGRKRALRLFYHGNLKIYARLRTPDLLQLGRLSDGTLRTLLRMDITPTHPTKASPTSSIQLRSPSRIYIRNTEGRAHMLYFRAVTAGNSVVVERTLFGRELG